MKALCRIVLFLLPLLSSADEHQFIRGADISFAKQAEESGFVFKIRGKEAPYLQILQQNGYNWIRLRLFYNPDSLPNNLEYTVSLAKQAKSYGFKFLLDLHYSDTWADPGNQSPPKGWENIGLNELCDSVSNYTFRVIQTLKDQSAMPDMVQVGNELSNGFLWPWGSLPHNWEAFAKLQNSAINAISKAALPESSPDLMMHFDKSDAPTLIVDFIHKLGYYNVPFDYLGLSYYPQWHGSIRGLKKSLNYIHAYTDKKVIIAETAYPWKEAIENNETKIVGSPVKQQRFLQKINRLCYTNNKPICAGCFYWEPIYIQSNTSLWDDDGNALPALYRIK